MRTLLILAMSCTASLGCGRFGFDLLPRKANATRPSGAEDAGASHSATGSADAGPTAHAGDAVSASENTDAGSLHQDDGGAQGPGSDGSTVSRDDCGLEPDALVCANFNDGTVPASSELVASDGNVDLSQGFLDSEITAAGGYAFVESSFEPVTAGALYLRLSMYLPSDANLRHVNFADFSELGGSTSTDVDFNILNGELEVYLHETSTRYIHAGFSLPLDTWFCFIARVELDDVNGKVQTWIEDMPLHDLDGIDTLTDLGVAEVAVGVPWVRDGQSTAQLIVDDLAVATYPLTECP